MCAKIKNMYRILLAEDEEHLLETIKLNLELEGYNVTPVVNGKEALETFSKQRFDLVILDVMMPFVDGLNVCEKIRLENTNVPIMFVTAKGSSGDRVAGLKIGADDYLTKPFDLEEFLLRVKKLIMRGLPPNEQSTLKDVFQFDTNEVNFVTYKVKGINNKEYTLTKKEIMLLKLLIERRNQVVSREQILENVWGYDIYPSTRTVDNFILAFRKYFEENPKNPKYFFSIRGVGYKFVY